MRLLAFVVALLALAGSAFAWVPGIPLPTRAGTIAHAKLQADGTTVTLDAVDVVKVCGRQFPAYIVVADPWDDSGNIIVKVMPSAALHLGMDVEVTGTVASEYSQKIINATSVLAYLNEDGSIFYGNVNKPDDTPATWKYSKGSVVGSNPPSSPVVTPTTSNLPAPTVYSSIADAKMQADGEWVAFVNKSVVSVGTDAGGKWALIAADGSNDTIKVYSTSDTLITDRAYVVSGLLGTQDGNRIVSTNAGPDLDLWSCIPAYSLFNSGHISWAKAQPDGTNVMLPGKIVSAKYIGYYYIQEPDRSCGIKVISSRAIGVGKTNNINKAVVTTINGEKCLTSVNSSIGTQPVVRVYPLGMTNKSLGADGWQFDGGGSTNGQQGVDGGVGLNNVGLFVRIWGKITYIEPQRRWYVIDDGTGATWQDGATTRTGVKISLGDSATYLPLKDETGADLQVGDYVEGVNGVSSVVLIDSVPYRCLRQVGAFNKAGPYWFPINKVNRVGSPGIGGTQ